jgi:hypothetical protein
MISDDREHRIRQRAHEIWEREGRPSGRDREHWERAQHDVDSGLDKADRHDSHATHEQRSQATVKSPEAVVPPSQDESQAAVAAKVKKTVESGEEKKTVGSAKPASTAKAASAKKPAAKKPTPASKRGRNA